AYLGCGDLPGPLRRLQPACPVAVAIARGLALSALVTFAPKLVARFRLQHLLDDQPHREANQLRTVSLRPQPSIDERPKPLACLLRRRYSLHHGMLPEGFRRQPKARSPASLRQGASQTFFQQIYAFTVYPALMYARPWENFWPCFATPLTMAWQNRSHLTFLSAGIVK